MRNFVHTHARTHHMRLEDKSGKRRFLVAGDSMTPPFALEDTLCRFKNSSGTDNALWPPPTMLPDKTCEGGGGNGCASMR